MTKEDRRPVREYVDMWEYLGVSPEDEYADRDECWHQFDDGDMPNKPTDKCRFCGKTAKELGLMENE